MELLKTFQQILVMSSDQLTLVLWLFFLEGGDDILPSYVGIIIKTHGSRGISRDPYEQTRIPMVKS